MSYLKIEKVSYFGDEYYYESPNFDNGINVIEGPNGSGKSTLIDLICYGLGCYVKHFDSKSNNIHQIICNDKNNYVILNIQIDNVKYVLQRYINSKENYIFIENEDEIMEFPVNRHIKTQKIFSDWLLEKLNIHPIEIYNNRYDGIINFEELFRLIHYEQKSNQSKIYKEAKVDGNFVSDSLIRRKAIFEILMGKNLIEYYSCLNEYKINEKEYVSNKNVFETFEKSIDELYSINIIERGSNKEEMIAIEQKIDKIQDEIYNIAEKEYTSNDFLKELSDLKDEITDVEFLLKDKKNEYSCLANELDKINILIKDKQIEIEQLKKIVFTHQELNIFSPSTCPYCFNEVTRKVNHCVCGNIVNEDYFEKSFYNMEEYLTMIKQKLKSLEILKEGRDSILEDIEKSTEQINSITKELKQKKNLILSLKIDNKLNCNITSVKRLNDELNKLQSDFNLLEEYESLYNKAINLREKMNESKKKFVESTSKLKSLEELSSKNINDMINKFSSIYNKLMQKVVDTCTEAHIDEDYMPVINNGVYINASVAVQVKLVYFITLLWRSLLDNVNFPRLLIIDTPESLGIDKNNLNKTLEVLTELPKSKDYQIILTTGIDKYPMCNEFVLKVKMKSEKELLKKRK
ncbi:hypothetical protein [Clostridium baratii]|uniref:hypothetical protein n=1 Tax=Clostridium baratii TaxID=1561 RepID=UPI00370455C5